jgi:Na+/proline symporter
MAQRRQSLLDWTVVAIYFALVFVYRNLLFRKAGENTGEFFLSGRKFAVWLAGRLWCDDFRADTPLAGTELVAKNGVAAATACVNLAIGAMLTSFSLPGSAPRRIIPT